MSDVPVVDPVRKAASPASDLDKALAAAKVLVEVEYDSEPGGVPAEAIARFALEQRAQEAELWYSLPGTAGSAPLISDGKPRRALESPTWSR